MEDAELGALLLDLQGLKGELPRIMPGRGGVAQAQRVRGGSRFSASQAQALVLRHSIHISIPSWTTMLQRSDRDRPSPEKKVK